MDPNNPVSSNSGQFDENNAAFIKQQQQQQTIEPDFDLNRVICGMARNGKHQDGDGDDYDYSDLGPETDVDGGEDAADVANRSSSELLVTSSSSLCEKSETEVDNMQKDLLVRDLADLICAMDSKAVDDNLVRSLSDRDACCDERSRAGNDDNEARVESTTGTHIYDDVDDDESPPSLLRAAKSLQHALSTEVEENVADSEESEEEWNFYRNPDKEVSATTDEFSEGVEKLSIQNPKSGPEGEGEIQSSKVEASIECERAEKEASSKPVLIIDTSKKEEPSESEERNKLADDDKQVDMDGFQLNPEAAEFVPLSPPLLNNKNLQDYPISGSPLKQTPAMDDILVPSQSEFEKEVSLRPKEIDENDQQLPRGEQNLLDLDASEISSTKAEMGDESTMRNASQWSTTTRNDDAEGSDEEGYEIVNMDSCAMTMSFTPGDLEAVFEKGVDLNAVHELNDSSDDAEHINSPPPRSPGGLVVTVDGDGRTDTPLLEFDDKGSIDLLCASSTPHLTQGDQSSTRTGASETENLGVSVFKPDAGLPTDQLGVAPLDSTQMELKDILNESKYTISEYSSSDDADTLGDERKVVPEQPLGELSSEKVFSKEKSPEQLKLTEETMKRQKEEELDLRGDKTQLEATEVRCNSNYKMKHPQLLAFENAMLRDLGLLKLTEEEQASEEEAKTQSEDPKLIKDDSETTVMSMEQKLQRDRAAMIERRDEMARALHEFNKDNFMKEKEQEEGEVSEGEAKTWPESGVLLIPADQITTPIRPISPASREKLKYIEAMNNLRTKSYPEFYGPTDPIFYPETIDSDTEKEFEKEGGAKQPDINYTDTIITARDPPTQSNWNELYKTNNKTMLLQIDDDDQNCSRAYESKYLKKTDEVEKHDVENDEDDRHDEGGKNDDVKPDRPTDPSDAVKDFTSLEKPDSQPKDQSHQPTEQKLVEEEAKLEIAKVESEDVGKLKDESKEQKSVDLVTKAKATTTTAKRPTKTTSTTTKVAATKTKTVTSSSKVSTTGTRVSTTPSPSQATSAKKFVAARPKQLVETSRAPSSSSSAGGSRVPSTKTTTSSRVTMTTSAAATASKTSVSPRVGTTTKSRPITASSSKSSTSTSGTEKKPSLGEASKQVTNRVTATRAPTTAKTSTTTTKTTLSAKPSSTTITATTKTSSTTSSVASKRPSSATTTSRTLTARQSATTGASRPKTAPAASATASTRPRNEGSSTTKPATAKSPLTDKQIKDSANKEISRSGALSSSKTTGGSKPSTLVVGSTAAAKSRLSIGKSPGKSTISPIKKTTLTPKAASRTPTAASTLTPGSKSGAVESPKVLQNGIPEKKVVDLVNRSPVITGSDKPEDDVPRKDASPVNVPTDNQLIVTE